MHFSRDIPAIPIQRQMNIGRLASAMRDMPDPPAWSALFVKACALVATEFPELRRAYLPYPLPRLVEYPFSAISVVIERKADDGRYVYPYFLKAPENSSLADVSNEIRLAKSGEIDGIRCLRRIRAVSGYPLPIRRLVWWIGLNLVRPRGNFFGTGAITAVADLGADILRPISPLPYLLSYGPLDDAGSLTVRLIFDHRVLDAATGARALIRLEELLNGPLIEEVSANRPTGTG